MDKLDIVGPREAAEILGWDPRRVHVYISRDSFPEPVAELAATKVWYRSQIEEFKRTHKPRRKPLKKVEKEGKRKGKEAPGDAGETDLRAT